MATIAFPPWEPDKAALNPSASANIRNVIPNADGYGPFPALTPFSTALATACRGAFLGRNGSGTYAFFAGAATKLYRLSGTGWDDVSTGAYSLPAGDSWSFTQIGDDVIAANIADVPQTYTIGSSTDFGNLSGTPPHMKFVWVESGYLGGGHVTGSESTIYRSGLNSSSFWTYGSRGSTYQPLPDGGVVQGAITAEAGAIIFQEKKIRLLNNRPGEDVGFTINSLENARGAKAAHAIVPAGSNIFFLSEEGFFKLGTPSEPIGAERIDKTFLDDIDLTRMTQVQGVVDNFRKMVWWRYSSVNNTANTAYTDKLIGYSWVLDRWAYAEINLEWIIPFATPGYTLEELNSVLGYTNIDTMTISLDSPIFKGGTPAFGAFDSAHKLGLFNGAALEAVLDTADIPLGGEGRRHFVSGFRPVGDIDNSYGAAIAKSTFGDTNTTPTTENQQGTTGLIPMRVNARISRLRLRIPAAEEWTHLQGIEIPPECLRTAGRR